MPLPPETTIRALASSGLAERVSSCPTKDESPGSVPAGTVSIAADPPEAGAASNAVARTVKTLIASRARNVTSALPA